MAIAGINSGSVLESPYLAENYSPVSRRWGNQERPITQTSFIRKMWRDLEGESRYRENERQPISGMANGNMGSLCSCSSEGGAQSEYGSINTNEGENECPQDQNQMVLQNGHEDSRNLCLQRPPAFDVAEKQRVRQVFHEWGSKSFSGCALNVSHKNNYSRAQRLCENECKRVRTVRQWIENTQQAETGHSGIQEQATEIGFQIERVQDGLGVNHIGVGMPRSIRRLYGRQALLDLLTRFDRERKRELQSLLENRPVSNFAHQNRIQSLLRGRFLWNQRFVQDEKSTSIAASELGLLRPTHTVSDLRRGFLSRLDNNEHIPDVPQSDTSSDNDMKYHQENFQELPDDIVNEFVTTNMRSDIGGTHGVDWETKTCRSPRENAAPVAERHERVSENEGRQQLPPTEFIETRDQDREGSVERNQGVHHVELSQRTLELECTAQDPPLRPGTILHGHYQSNGEELEVHGTILHGHYQSNGEELEVHEASDHLSPSEMNTDSLSWQEGYAEAEEWREPITEDNGSEWHHVVNIESDEGLDANSIENEHEWYQETAGSDFQESHDGWYDNALEDTTESWFGGNLYQEAPPVVRTDAFYTSDDNNGNRLELQELMSRRRVSNLLQSDFRVRLDQLIQSYVERQDQPSESDDEWMQEREQQDQDQQSVDENDDVTGAVETTEGDHSSQPAIPQTVQDDTFLDIADWHYPDVHQHFGTEWEIINGLRIDMVRLQERMNSMKTLLETCMNMQLELQRSVQQEISSALNRSSSSGEDSLQKEEPKWNPGKEGVCFLCCDGSFDSSPDRRGHVYVCSKCAEKINWSKLKESVRHP